MPITYRSMGLYIQLPKISSRIQTVKTTVCHLNFCSSFLVDRGYFVERTRIWVLFLSWIVFWKKVDRGQLETRRGLEPKCIPQFFVGSFLGAHWSAIGRFFPLLIPIKSPRSHCESQLSVVSFSYIKWWINVRAFCDYPEGVKYCTGIYMLSLD